MKDDDKNYFVIDIVVEKVVQQESSLQIYSKDYSPEQIQYMIENYETLTTDYKPIDPSSNPYKGLKEHFKFKDDKWRTKFSKKQVSVTELTIPQTPEEFSNIPKDSPYRSELEEDYNNFKNIDRKLWGEFLRMILHNSRKNPNFDEEEFKSL